MARQRDQFFKVHQEAEQLLRELGIDTLAAQRLYAASTKVEFASELLGIIRLQIEKRSLEEVEPRFLLWREVRQPPNGLRLCEGVDVREQSRDNRAFGDLRLHGREFVGDEGALFLFELDTDRLAARASIM